MLRWTCRLRDFFESRYDVDRLLRPDQLSLLREAELVGQGEESGLLFPDTLDWNTVVGSYRCGNELVMFYHPVEDPKMRGVGQPHYVVGMEGLRTQINQEHEDSIHAAVELNNISPHAIRSLSGQTVDITNREPISVIWLTSDVFVSSMSFYVDVSAPEPFDPCTYKVVLINRQDPMKVFHFHAYSLSAFQNLTVALSDLPLRFVRKLTEPLPADYFSSCVLNRQHGLQFPPDYVDQFLSFIPHDAQVSESHSYHVTTFALPTTSTEEELQAIMSHRFNPVVQIAFSSFYPLSMDRVNNLLREWRDPPSLNVPEQLVIQDRPDESFAANETLRSLAFPIPTGRRDDLSTQMVEALAQNEALQDLELRIDCTSPPPLVNTLPLKHLWPLFGHFMRAKSGPKRMTIRCSWVKGMGSKECAIQMLMASGITFLCQYCCNLSFVNVSFDHFILDRHSVPENMDNDPQWDELVSPSLILNFYRSNTKNTIGTGGVLSRMFSAINSGVAYRKTSDHIPYDMSIANAGLIYDILRNDLFSDQK
jgi:hypothetical protein